MAHTLLYSLQLAIQLKVHSYSGLSDKHNSVPTCPELDQELELDRARGFRPASDVCCDCREKNACTSPKTCAKTPRAVSSACQPERNPPASQMRMGGVEGPSVSSPEATSLNLPRPCDHKDHPALKGRAKPISSLRDESLHIAPDVCSG
jgi:hypothetical protein